MFPANRGNGGGNPVGWGPLFRYGSGLFENILPGLHSEPAESGLIGIDIITPFRSGLPGGLNRFE